MQANNGKLNANTSKCLCERQVRNYENNINAVRTEPLYFMLFLFVDTSSVFNSIHTTGYIWISNTTPLHTLFHQNIAKHNWKINSQMTCKSKYSSLMATYTTLTAKQLQSQQRISLSVHYGPSKYPGDKASRKRPESFSYSAVKTSYLT